ncbi:50S ribosomal protein L19e [Candidatus Micrarchaeota archaeon]|jgi:large subunit ribosomal protein L19e|nr:50S ribosomal protein L19e [Candidatus Micrarchaeota archaeon]
MGMATVRRIAAELLGVGESRVRIDPKNASKAEEALTRDDIRSLISQGVIYALRKRGVSRARGRKKHLKMKVGRRRGTGSRKGKRYSIVPRKTVWIHRVRAQRALLKNLLLEKKIQNDAYRKVYRMVKGGAFKSRASLLTHLKDNQMIK